MLKPYFKLENVIDGVFNLTKTLYGLTYKENKKIEKYHPDVTIYEVYREKDFLGILYLDFHPRASKRGGAWMTSLREQSIDEKGNNIRPLVSLVMNFTPSTPDNPSLLTFDEVTTFYMSLDTVYMVFSPMLPMNRSPEPVFPETL